MEFSEKGPMDPMNGHFSPINGLESINGIQFSLCGTTTNLIFAHRAATSFSWFPSPWVTWSSFRHSWFDPCQVHHSSQLRSLWIRYSIHNFFPQNFTEILKTDRILLGILRASFA